MKILKILAIFLLAAGIVLYFVSAPLLERASRKAADYIEANSAKYGLNISNIRYEKARLEGLTGAGWRKPSMNVIIQKSSSDREAQAFTLEAEKIFLKAEHPAEKKFVLKAEDLHVVFHPHGIESEAGPQERQTQLHGDLSYRFQLDFAQPARIQSKIKTLLVQLGQFVKQGGAEADLHFEGKITVFVKGAPAEVKIYTVKEGSVTKINADKEDLKKISRRMREKLTDAEIEIIATHPVYAPRLLAITEYAVSKAEAAERKDPSISEDAYKHVLWSYRLTKSFGPAFAQRVTDAHEEGDPDDTDADHRMDRNNNEIGRRYALSGVPESELLDKVRKDPAILRLRG